MDVLHGCACGPFSMDMVASCGPLSVDVVLTHGCAAPCPWVPFLEMKAGIPRGWEGLWYSPGRGAQQRGRKGQALLGSDPSRAEDT